MKKLFIFLMVSFFWSGIFAAEENPIRQGMIRLQDSLQSSKENFYGQNYEMALKFSKQNLKTAQAIKDFVLPFLERLKEAVKIQTEISETLKNSGETIRKTELSLEEKQHKNLFHTSVLEKQAESSKPNPSQSSSKALSEKMKLAQKELKIARNLEEQNLKQSKEGKNLSLKLSDQTKIHLENALKLFSDSKNQKNDKNSENEEKKNSDQASQNSSSQNSEKKQDENPDENKSESDSKPNPSASDKESQESNSLGKIQKLSPEKALQKLSELNERKKEVRRQRILESGKKPNSKQRPSADKNW